MKKLLISLGIAFVLLLGTFGAVILAAPPDKPLDSWEYIKDKVDTIWNILTNANYGLEEIDIEVENIQSTVDGLVADVGNVHAFTNAVTFDTFTPDTPYPLSEPYDYGDQVRHVSVTIHTDDLPGLLHYVEVYAVIHPDDPETLIHRFDVTDFEGNETTQTVEFNAVSWYISYFYHLGALDEVRISYSVVETY